MSRGKKWTLAEDTLLRQHYNNLDILKQSLPHKTAEAIK